MSFNKFFSKGSYFFDKANKFIKTYKFKIFKKTTRFKKYSIGPTKYIINRKKYQTRKKRTTNLLNYYPAGLWSMNYKKKAQVVKYIQTVYSFSRASVLVNKNYIFKKTASLPSVYINTSSISSNLIYNKTLFTPLSLPHYNLLHKNSTIGYLYSNNTTQATGLTRVQPFNNINYNNIYLKDTSRSLFKISKTPITLMGALLLRKITCLMQSFYIILTLLSLLCINL